MNRYQSVSYVSASIAASGSLNTNTAGLPSLFNIQKITVTPDSAGGTYDFKVFKADTFAAAKLLAHWDDVPGIALFDPVDNAAGVGAAQVEALEGANIPYDDDDGSGELHTQISNSDIIAHTYTVTIMYEEVPLMSALGAATFRAGITAGGAIIGGTIGPSVGQQHTLPAVASDTIALLAAAQALTNKTISGASNTLSNIGNASLANSSITVTAGTGLSGGGVVSLGGTAALSINQAFTPTWTALHTFSAGLNLGTSQSINSTTSRLEKIGGTTVGTWSATGLVVGGALSSKGTMLILDSTGAVSFEIRPSLASLRNTLAGFSTGSFITTADQNTAFGQEALAALTEGSGNTAIGQEALTRVTTGDLNMGIGIHSGGKIVSGSYNVSIGYSSLGENIVSNGNTSVGTFSLMNTTSENNTAVGYEAAKTNTNGAHIVAVGYRALFTFNTVADSTAIGWKSLELSTGANNVAAGSQSMTVASTAASCVSVGMMSMFSTTTGGDNTAVGCLALYSNQTGTSNTAIGREALKGCLGSNNIGIGLEAGETLTTATNCIIIGHRIDPQSNTTNGQLSIGNLIFGTGLAAIGTNFAAGNVGIRTATFGTSGVGVFGIANGTEPSTSPADMVQIYSVDLSAGNATIGIRTETAVVTETVVSDRTLSARINGVTLKFCLKA